MSDRMRFYLVQRLKRRSEPAGNAVGFDQHFALEYMGSSEFEWGAIPKALQSVRVKPVTAKVIPITLNGTTRDVHVVTHAGKHEQAGQALQAWGAGSDRRPPFCGKEASHFDFQFFGIERPYDTTEAWWSIDDDVAFALDAKAAELLVRAFNEKPEKKR
ncbi:hypothetical protein KK103_11795 [Curtobacterium flaccumfaciens pv. flaccumfaciens]|uniref:Uncharacterized protein n=1 Tax=Curtobacterium flaccumfaciens pv. flaccumfaciens TaxID=138532 RepID=A0A9Q2W315_9MICO|nr:hypothetical protein [Curtobacterium flaccumfaciens]MBT1542447.1 hypothetical protein [Curtobacterium flaccumfaciens pv. flaccumfaciens]